MFYRSIMVAGVVLMISVNTASAAEPHSTHYIIDMAGAGQPVATAAVIHDEVKPNGGLIPKQVFTPMLLKLRSLAITSRPHN